VRKEYENEVKMNLKENNVHMNVDLVWEKVSYAVKKSATKSIGEVKRSRNTCYNNVRRIAVDKRRKARDDFIKKNTQTTKEIFIREQKNSKSTLQREKIKYFSSLLQTAKNDHTQGRTRNFFRVIKQFKRFNPIWNAIKDQNGQMLKEPESRAERWKGYFEKLLTHRCENYRGISLLNSAYKVFARVLLNRIVPYVEDCFGVYQCGFRKDRSTVEQLSIIGQIIEKRYEYRQNMWQHFIDFKKAYDTIHKESHYNIMYESGFPKN